jgi:DNA-binding NtrC family response regulator
LEDNLTKAIELYEKAHIERTLGKTAGDKIRAAELLGLSLSTLYRKIEKLGVEGSPRVQNVQIKSFFDNFAPWFHKENFQP